MFVIRSGVLAVMLRLRRPAGHGKPSPVHRPATHETVLPQRRARQTPPAQLSNDTAKAHGGLAPAPGRLFDHHEPRPRAPCPPVRRTPGRVRDGRTSHRLRPGIREGTTSPRDSGQRTARPAILSGTDFTTGPGWSRRTARRRRRWREHAFDATPEPEIQRWFLV